MAESEEFLEQLSGLGLRTRPFRAVGYLTALFGAGFLFSFILMPFCTRLTHGETVAVIFCDITLGPLFVIWIVYGTQLANLQRSASLTNIDERSLFSSSSLEIADVEWIRTVKIGSKDQFEMLELGDEQHKYRFMYSMAHYAELRDYLLAHVDPHAIELGKSIKPKFLPMPGLSYKALHTGGYLMMIPLLLSMAISRRVDAVDARERSNMLDARGAITMGRIVGENKIDSVEFAFEVGPQHIQQYCSVPPKLARRLHRGDSVKVIYLPDKPRVSRIVGSDDYEEAAGEIRFADVYGAIGVLVPLTYVWWYRRWYDRQMKAMQAR